MSDDQEWSATANFRWAESLAGIARTGLAFTESQYDRERYEEILHVAGDMIAAFSDSSTSNDRDHAAEWLGSVVAGMHGYVTPKIGVGAFVGNENDELLLIKRADLHKWSIPMGWADIGYSPSEVVIKEVAEECGVDVEPLRLVGVYDNLRGGHPVPHYTMLFACKLIGGELKPHPLECEDIGWFRQDALPQPMLRMRNFLTDIAFQAIRGEQTQAWFDPPRQPVWRRTHDFDIATGTTAERAEQPSESGGSSSD